MPQQQPRADVIVTADRDASAVERCLQNLLVHSGPSLGRLIVIDDSADPNMAGMLERLVTIDSRLHVVRNSSRLGRVGSFNRGLGEPQRRRCAREYGLRRGFRLAQ